MNKLIVDGETPMLTTLRFPRAPIATLAALLTLTAALTACAVTTTGGGGSSPTATAAPTNTTVATTCAQVSGFSGATPVNIANTEFPKDTVVTAPTTTGGGPGQFTVKEYYGCAPNTDTNLTVQTGKGPEPFMHLQEFYGWAPSSTFPNDGEVQTACAANSCLDFGQEHSRFLSVTNATALPNSLVTFRLRVINAPLPPLTLAAPDDASGGVRGEDLCGPGTVASITAFMTKALPAAGWTKGSNSNCIFSAQCWTKGSDAVSWQVTDPKNWLIAHRVPLT
jgi:hypothetical protein